MNSPSITGAATAGTPSNTQRITALETLIEHLVFVLDAQGHLDTTGLDHWLATAIDRMRATGSAGGADIAALARLHTQVCA